MLRQSLPTSGFTLVEVIVVVTVTGILTGLLFGPLSDLYFANAQGLTSIVQATDVKTSLRSMEKTIAFGNAFAAITDATDADNNIWKWNNTSGLLGSPLIIKSNATEVNAQGNRVIATVYMVNCNNVPTRMTYNTVFFVKKDASQNVGTLYRRTIIPSPATTCDDPIKIEQKNSCQSPASNPTNCSVSDAVIATNVTGFTVQYFSASDSATAVTPDEASFPTYKTATVTLTTTVGVGSTKTSVTNALRMSLINV